jgi:long-chain fatty acid transport protein
LGGLSLLTASASASPEDLFGFGGRSPAMAGMGAAMADDYEAAYANPALLSRIRSMKLSLGLQGASFDLHAAEAGFPSKVSYEAEKGVVIGADLPVPFAGRLKDRVALGFAFFTPSEVLVRGRLLYAETPQFPILPDRAQSLAVRAGLGIDLGYGLRIGAGFAALAELSGGVQVATNATGKVGSRVEDQLLATYSPTLGASWDLPLDRARFGHLRLGVTFRGALEARFAVEIDATKLSSLRIPVFNIAGVAQYDPAQLEVELADEVGPWTFAVGATYKKWSDYPGLVEPTIVCPPDNPGCGIQPPKLAFSDTIVPRVSVARALPLSEKANLELRGGAFYEPTPTPSAPPQSQSFDPTSAAVVNVPTRFFDASRLALTLGAGVTVPPFSIDTYAQVHALAARHVDLGSGLGADLSGSVLVTGLVAGVKF